LILDPLIIDWSFDVNVAATLLKPIKLGLQGHVTEYEFPTLATRLMHFAMRLPFAVNVIFPAKPGERVRLRGVLKVVTDGAPERVREGSPAAIEVDVDVSTVEPVEFVAVTSNLRC
jgi:hypothetical protein